MKKREEGEKKDCVDHLPPGNQLVPCSHLCVLKPNVWFIAEFWNSMVSGHQAIYLHHAYTESLILTLMYGHKISTRFRENPQIQKEQTQSKAISITSCCSKWIAPEILLMNKFFCCFNPNVLRWLNTIFECSAKGLMSSSIPYRDHSRIKHLSENLKCKVLILLLPVCGWYAWEQGYPALAERRRQPSVFKYPVRNAFHAAVVASH